jgi:ribulose-bisphosphate carboxylase large chain
VTDIDPTGIDPTDIDPTGVITAVYEIHGDDAETRAAALAVEQSHELPTELAPPIAVERSLGVVRELTGGDSAIATVDYPVGLAGGELPQLLVLLLGNVSLQPGIRLVDVAIPHDLAGAIGGPRLGVDGVRALTGVSGRPLLATALKPVGLDSAAIAALAYELAVGGLDIVKEDQGLANQPWAPFLERVPLIAEAVRRANAETGRRTLYLPVVDAPVAGYDRQLHAAREAGADGVMVLPGVGGWGALRHASNVLAGGMVLSHPSFLGGFTASPTHGIAPDVLFGTLVRLAGADASIFPSFGGRFSLSREQCVAIAEAARRPLAGLAPALPAPGGGMQIDRVPELRDAYGDDTVFLIGADLQRGEPRAAARRFAAAVGA